MFTFIGTEVENLIRIKQIVFFSKNYFGVNSHGCGKSCEWWEMIYITKGQVRVTANETETILGSGEAIFHKPYEYHQVTTYNCENVEGYTVSFYCSSKAMEFFKEWHGRLSDNSKRLFDSLINEASVSFRLSLNKKSFSLVPSASMPFGGFQVFKNYLELLLINILRDESELNNLKAVFSQKEGLYSEISNQIFLYLSEHIYDDITIEKICRQFNYSRTLLCTKFREYTGVSIMKYYVTLKIEEACRLLNSGEYSISEISSMLSYSTQYNFSRTFKKIIGISPSQYQKQRK